MKNKKGHPVKSSPKKTRAHSNELDTQKLRGMLLRFASGESYHRFAAEHVGDHCLNTTISSLQKSHGIYFSREWVKVANRFGTKTPVKRYWLEGENLKIARKVFGLDKVTL